MFTFPLSYFTNRIKAITAWHRWTHPLLPCNLSVSCNFPFSGLLTIIIHISPFWHHPCLSDTDTSHLMGRVRNALGVNWGNSEMSGIRRNAKLIMCKHVLLKLQQWRRRKHQFGGQEDLEKNCLLTEQRDTAEMTELSQGIVHGQWNPDLMKYLRTT